MHLKRFLPKMTNIFMSPYYVLISSFFLFFFFSFLFFLMLCLGNSKYLMCSFYLHDIWILCEFNFRDVIIVWKLIITWTSLVISAGCNIDCGSGHVEEWWTSKSDDFNAHNISVPILSQDIHYCFLVAPHALSVHFWSSLVGDRPKYHCNFSSFTCKYNTHRDD